MTDSLRMRNGDSISPECRNCNHSIDYHPARFLCHEDGCRCPEWVEKAAGTT